MEILEAKKIVKDFNEKNRFRDCGKLNNAIDTIIKELDNSISKDDVRKKMDEYVGKYHNYLDGMEKKLSHLQDEHKIRATYAEFGVLKGKTEILQELLKEE